MTNTVNLLELRNVTIQVWNVKEAQWVQLFTDWSFKMNAGETVVVLGGSGAGKTTLLHFIAGFLRPTKDAVVGSSPIRNIVRSGAKHAQVAGSVLMLGEDITMLPPQERRVGLVMQRYTLYEHMNVRENLEFPLRMRGVARESWDERVKMAIKRVGLEDRVLSERAIPQHLAGGQMQRIAIAKMLLREPRLALFDEAFSNLDLLLRTQLRETVVGEFIRERPQERGVIFVSHNVESARNASKIVFLPDPGVTNEGPLVFGGKGVAAWEEFCSCDKSVEIQKLVLRVYEIAKDWSSVNRNAFGERRYTPNEVLQDKVVVPVVKKALGLVGTELGISEDKTARIADEMFNSSDGVAMSQMEENMRRRFQSWVTGAPMRRALDRRAERVVGQIEKYVVGEDVADIGCGDGMVGWALQGKGKRVAMIDVVNYLDGRVKLPLHLYKEGASLPAIQPADTSLLLTVLHHSNDPVKLLEETRRITRRRCIIIESVYGIERIAPGAASFLTELDRDGQRRYATFVDWLYNRVFHDGVPVPYNYNTPHGWKRLLEDMGWCVTEMVDLGMDQPIVPEHHMLFVLDKA